jgi:hypothetical protein
LLPNLVTLRDVDELIFRREGLGRDYKGDIDCLEGTPRGVGGGKSLEDLGRRSGHKT